MSILQVNNINKSFGNNHVLKNVSFSMEKGEVYAIIGSSGGGKSTLLRCLTFLEKIDSGTIEIDDELIVSEKEVKSKVCKVPVLKKFVNKIGAGEIKKVSVYPKDDVLRVKALKMGLVFQDFNLFPHLNVLDNLMLAPTLVSHSKKEEAMEIAMSNLEKVGLADKAKAYPSEISGGQKQRAAIARALCMSPQILCFDEPTSALDPELTGEVLKVISGLRDTGVTMLIVTHEISFAREIADKVIFLDNGIILESGDAREVIDNPKKERTREFMQRIL